VVLFPCEFQIEEEGQLHRATQNEQDNYEMQVRAANIVSIYYLFVVFIWSVCAEIKYYLKLLCTKNG
jgi:hypothetical protein